MLRQWPRSHHEACGDTEPAYPDRKNSLQDQRPAQARPCDIAAADLSPRFETEFAKRAMHVLRSLSHRFFPRDVRKCPQPLTRSLQQLLDLLEQLCIAGACLFDIALWLDCGCLQRPCACWPVLWAITGARFRCRYCSIRSRCNSFPRGFRWATAEADRFSTRRCFCAQDRAQYRCPRSHWGHKRTCWWQY